MRELATETELLPDEAARLRAGPAVSWGAIFAGAAVALATSLILLALGSGLGLASISPWSGSGVSAGTLAVSSVIWLIITQWVSAAMGGYITGRLRHRWLATHGHEVFFRDTAHGLVTWALATTAVAVVAAGSIRALAEAAPDPSALARSDAADAVISDYDVDKLFRAAGASANNAGNGAAAGSGAAAAEESSRIRAEAAHLAINAVDTGNLGAEDRTYLASLVAASTGAGREEAAKRVDVFITAARDAQLRMKEAADHARKNAANTAIFTALAMLIGAFIASVAGAIGGRLRDAHP